MDGEEFRDVRGKEVYLQSRFRRGQVCNVHICAMLTHGTLAIRFDNAKMVSV